MLWSLLLRNQLVRPIASDKTLSSCFAQLIVMLESVEICVGGDFKELSNFKNRLLSLGPVAVGLHSDTFL